MRRPNLITENLNDLPWEVTEKPTSYCRQESPFLQGGDELARG